MTMAMIQFVQNYEDLSTDKGFQFKFYCDKCGNGHMTHFQTSAIGMAESALQIAGSIFGGVIERVGYSAYDVQRAVGGKAHDSALEAAIQEGKQHFHQCSRCGKWVCPDVCWNAKAGQCEECAPNFEEQLASAHAQAKAEAARQQLFEKAQQQNYVGNIDMGAGAYVPAPAPYQAPPYLAPPPAPPAAPPAGLPGGPAVAAGDRCTGCGAAVGASKFCPQCGVPRAAPGCPGCHAPLQPNTRFCGNCGTRIA